MMKKFKSYFIEFIIVTAGVMIALFLSNFKESNQARKYHEAAIRTINMEVQSNYFSLNQAIEKQTNTNDTLIKYSDSPETVYELLSKSTGFNAAALSNTGLEFYKNDKLNSIDFELMASLILMKALSDHIMTRVEKLADIIFSTNLDNSKESKQIIILHLESLLSTEKQLLKIYEDFIDEYVENNNTD